MDLREMVERLCHEAAVTGLSVMQVLGLRATAHQMVPHGLLHRHHMHRWHAEEGGTRSLLDVWYINLLEWQTVFLVLQHLTPVTGQTCVKLGDNLWVWALYLLHVPDLPLT